VNGQSPSQLAGEDWDCLRMAFPVIDEGSINGPIHPCNRPGCQIGIQSSSFADQCKLIACFCQGLQLNGVRNPRELVDLEANLAQQFQNPAVRAGMSLRVLEERKILLQVLGLDRRFCG
jgi:hypothetical protein